MGYILVGIFIILVVLIAPFIWAFLVWSFNNPIIIAILLIAIGVIKVSLNNILFKQDESDNYITDYDGRKQFKELGEIAAGFFVYLFLALGFIFLIYYKFG